MVPQSHGILSGKLFDKHFLDSVKNEKETKFFTYLLGEYDIK